MILFWLAVIVIMGITEALTTGIVTIWFMAGAFLALICRLMHLSILIQILVFILSSFLFLIITRPLIKKYIDSKKVQTNADSLIGKTAIVIKPIQPHITGQVKIKGQIWTAVNEYDNEPLENNEEVLVTGIEGVKLIVKKIFKEETQC
jgi:membrane protein implicated in regulation of membrane protease activity